MVLMRDLIRTASLSPVFSAAKLEVVPQYGPFALFLTALAVGAAVLAWMIRSALKAGKNEGGSK
jgi:multisubunit Na+/H+ antiporter MnhC subunit